MVHHTTMSSNGLQQVSEPHRNYARRSSAAFNDSAAERPPATDFQRALPQFLAVGVKNVLLFGYGMTLGFPTIVIPAIQGGDGRDPHHDIVLNREEISWFSSINLLCVPLGCIFSGMFTQPIGKRRAMQIVNIPIMAAWLLFYFSSNIYHLYAGLCLAGLSGGLMEAPVLTYVAEITEPRFRGMLSATGSTCVICGVFTQFLLGSLLQWRTIAAISTVFPLISIAALFFVPESPHWLMLKGRYAEAQRSLAWLRGWVPIAHVQREYDEIYDILVKAPAEERLKVLETEQKSYLQTTLRRYVRQSFLRPYALIALCFFVGHFSGKTTLQTYAVQIFHTLKAPIDKYWATVLLGGVEIVGTLVCVALVHYTGKRPLVLVSLIGCGLCFLGTATYARFLDVVPGAVVENVVANVSAVDFVIRDGRIIAGWNGTSSEAIMIEPAGGMGVANLNGSTALDMIIERQFSELLNRSSEEFVEAETMRTNIPLDFIGMNRNSSEMNEDADMIETTTSTFEGSGFDMEETTLSLLLVMYNDSSPSVEADASTADIKAVEVEVHDDILLRIPNVEENKYSWVPLTLLLMSAFFAHMGIKLIPWMLIGEVFPASVRSGASGISSGTGYVFGFLANKLFLSMLNAMTMPGTFWFYSAVALVGSVVLYFVLPETEGRTLMDIERHFASDKTKNAELSSSDASNNGTTTGTKKQADIIRDGPLQMTVVSTSAGSWNHDQSFEKPLGRRKSYDDTVEPRSEMTHL